jgi:hypothetical protein
VLTLDALVPPSRVVDSQSHNQGGEHLGDRGPADAEVGIGPSPGNQEAMPAEQRLGPHALRRPARPVQEPTQRGKPDPIGRLEARPRPVAAQALKLVAQHQDLDLLGLAAPEHQHHDRQHAADGEVDERPYFGKKTISLAHGDVGS